MSLYSARRSSSLDLDKTSGWYLGGHMDHSQGLFQQFWEKAPGQNWEKMIDLTTKLGEINDIEHYKGSKILSSKSSYFRLYYAKHTT